MSDIVTLGELMSETGRKLPADVLATQPDLEAEYATSAAIDPHDHLFWYVLDDPALLNKSQALASYLDGGRGTAVFLRDMLRETGLAAALARRENPNAPVSVLEFASGYGRVSRHFRTVMPEAHVVACDIHQQAVDFLRGLGIDACRSSSVPEELSTGRTFDVVFVLSFFTHMPRHTWTRWLKALQAQLKPGGLLIFTAHGEVSRGLMGVTELEPDGFHFTAASEQKDLPVAEYGNTVTVFDYVYGELEGTEMRLLQFREQGIGHHDVYVLQRQPGRTVYQTRAKSELAAVYASRSWRLTSPLRAISTRLRRRSPTAPP